MNGWPQLSTTTTTHSFLHGSCLLHLPPLVLPVERAALKSSSSRVSVCVSGPVGWLAEGKMKGGCRLVDRSIDSLAHWQRRGFGTREAEKVTKNDDKQGIIVIGRRRRYLSTTIDWPGRSAPPTYSSGEAGNRGSGVVGSGMKGQAETTQEYRTIEW